MNLISLKYTRSISQFHLVFNLFIVFLRLHFDFDFHFISFRAVYSYLCHRNEIHVHMVRSVSETTVVYSTYCTRKDK